MPIEPDDQTAPEEPAGGAAPQTTVEQGPEPPNEATEEPTAPAATVAGVVEPSADGPPPPPPPASVAPQPPPPPPLVYQPVAEPLGYRPPLPTAGQAATGATGQALAQPGAYRWEEYVGVGRRFLALLIDLILISVIGGFIAAAAGLAGDAQTVSGPLYAVAFLVMVGYHTLLEGAQGATVGKMALGIKVTMEDGSRLTWSAALVRNLLRLVDGIFSYLVGAVLVWNSPKRQRLGDRVAKTVVVRSR